jgi:hypothetical protein
MLIEHQEDNMLAYNEGKKLAFQYLADKVKDKDLTTESHKLINNPYTKDSKQYKDFNEGYERVWKKD